MTSKQTLKENEYLEVLTPIIKAAGQKALKKWLTFDRTNIELKSRTQIVTAIDKETEKMIIKSLRAHFPEHSFLGEESGKSRGKKTTHGKSIKNFLWIIDPIDGTTNFTIHNPLWSISVGLACEGKIICGLVYVPVLDEIYTAIYGQGAYLNGRRLRLNITPIKPGSGFTKFIHTFCHGERARDRKIALNYYRQQKAAALDCRQLGSAAIELAYVAAGRVDSLVIPGAKSWDVAAGALIAREAGASVQDFTGQEWNLKSGDIIAAKPQIIKSVSDRIKRACR